MAAITDRLPPVVVIYDSRGKRATKHFEDAHAAKRFYLAKMRDGKNPAVGEGTTPSDWAVEDEETAELNAAVEAAQAGDVGPAVLSVQKPQGVNPNATTRALVAGRALAKWGHARGIQPGMVAEVDAEFGKPNAVESEIHLRNAYHAIRGYFEALGMPVPEITSAGDVS